MSANQIKSSQSIEAKKYYSAQIVHPKQFLIHKQRSYKKITSLQCPTNIVIKKQNLPRALPQIVSYQAKKYSFQRFKSLQQQHRVQHLRKNVSLKHLRKEQIMNKSSKLKIEQIKSEELILLNRLQKYSNQLPQSSNSIGLKKGFKRNPFKDITDKKKLTVLKINKGDTSFDGNFQTNHGQAQKVASTVRIHSQNVLQNGLLRQNSTKKLKFVINPLQRYIKQIQEKKEIRSHIIEQKEDEIFNQSDILRLCQEPTNQALERHEIEELLSYEIFKSKKN